MPFFKFKTLCHWFASIYGDNFDTNQYNLINASTSYCIKIIKLLHSYVAVNVHTVIYGNNSRAEFNVPCVLPPGCTATSLPAEGAVHQHQNIVLLLPLKGSLHDHLQDVPPEHSYEGEEISFCLLLTTEPLSPHCGENNPFYKKALVVVL